MSDVTIPHSYVVQYLDLYILFHYFLLLESYKYYTLFCYTIVDSILKAVIALSEYLDFAVFHKLAMSVSEVPGLFSTAKLWLIAARKLMGMVPF